MGGGDEIDVMGAPVLQVQHFLHQLVYRQCLVAPGLEFLADLVVLAKDAGQVAAGKEYGSRASLPRDGRLLTVVQAGVGYLDLGARSADAGFPGQAVDAAAAGAAGAVGELLAE